MGINLFHGWAEEEYRWLNCFDWPENIPPPPEIYEEYALSGRRWGISASLDATIPCRRVTWEPFISGGYQDLDLDGSGEFGSDFNGTIEHLRLDMEREEWFVGAGVSILFGSTGE